MFSFDAAKSLGNRRTLKARVSKAIPKVIQPLMLDGKCSPSNNEENTMTYIAAWVAFLDLPVVAEKVIMSLFRTRLALQSVREIKESNRKYNVCLISIPGLLLGP